MSNIILIGMPGCGKTTVGRELAEILGLEFACTDEYVEAVTGMGIPKIFEEYGERRFRAEECAAVAELIKKTGAVIATGGGAVLDAENRRLLADGGVVVWLERDLELLARAGRPLSGDIGALRGMYAVRRPIYAELADIRVRVQGSVRDVAEEIISELKNGKRRG